jgi:hypothetical protein
MADGTLDEASFRYYIAQDSLYLRCLVPVPSCSTTGTCTRPCSDSGPATSCLCGAHGARLWCLAFTSAEKPSLQRIMPAALTQLTDGAALIPTPYTLQSHHCHHHHHHHTTPSQGVCAGPGAGRLKGTAPRLDRLLLQVLPGRLRGGEWVPRGAVRGVAAWLRCAARGGRYSRTRIECRTRRQPARKHFSAVQPL